MKLSLWEDHKLPEKR